ncbi:PIN-like domain-containing protein [Mesorhizobium sp. M0213]|uniref:PIN-like domain-containing protein n=1 Tax=Mesorhizobium sp. M0213 TaxID=2956917 RepID=UPI0033394172
MRLDPFVRDYQRFIADLSGILQSEETVFYLDTSVLMWAANIGRDARREFLAWCGSRPTGKMRVPVWAAHELHRHLLRGSLNANLKKAVSDAEAKLTDFARLTTERVDDALCIAKGYAGRNAYVTDVQKTVQRLKELGKIAGDEAASSGAADDVVDFVNDHILDTELDDIIRRINEVGELRYKHLMPPGYHDNKPENKFGDVVIWEEMLADLKDRTGPTQFDTVLISRDEKTDWVSSAPLVYNGGDKPQKSNRDMEFDVTLAHPLLIHEFSKKTSSRSLYVVPPGFVASALYYAPNSAGQASNVSKWFAASHRFDVIEKLATAALAARAAPVERANVAVANGEEAEPTVPPADLSSPVPARAFVAPSARAIASVNAFPLSSAYAQAPINLKDELVASWVNSLVSGELPPLLFGKAMSGLIASDIRWATQANALFEQIAPNVEPANWNMAVLAVICSAYFDASGELHKVPQSEAALFALQMEPDARAAPAFAALNGFLKGADAQLPYLPGTGRQKVPYALNLLGGGGNGKADLLREVRVSGQPALIDRVPESSPQTLSRLLANDPSRGCTGKELRAVIAKHLFVPVELLATTWDTKKITWSADVGLASVDTTSEGGLSSLADEEDGDND